MNESDTLVAVQGIIEYGISTIPRVIEVTDQLIKAKKASKAHEKRYEMKVSRLTDIAAQDTLIKEKKVETLAHASGAIV